MEGVAAGYKRTRAEEISTESPDAKRMRDDLVDILEGGDERDLAAAHELANFMKRFEEEIGLPASSCELFEPQTDLGYLLEASDDELGLPPAPNGDDKEKEVQVVEQEGGAAGFYGGWGFEDEVPGAYEFGVWAEGEVGADEDMVFDGLFDYSDGLGGAGADLPWRAESLSAL